MAVRVVMSWTLPRVRGQTGKLFEVVKHRGIPVFTFMNKLDRDGRATGFCKELEEVLGIASYPMNWA